MKSAKFLSKAALLVTLAVAAQSAFAQYRQVNLVSTSSRTTPWQDRNLVNGWGVAFFPGAPFWVADEATGKSTLYDQFGTPQLLVVTIPPAPSQPFGPIGSPTGIVTNSTAGFNITENAVTFPALFIFATLDGTISGWSPLVDLNFAVIAVDNSASGALYTGLAQAQTGPHNLLYAADAVNNRIDIYNSNFQWIKSFGDPNPPEGLSVYGVQNINNMIYVTYASPVPQAGGALDVFDLTGNFIKRLSTNGPGGPLEGAWGMAMSPSNFGPFSNALLVGNVDNGHINAFDPSSGDFLGSLKDTKGQDFHIGGLWALAFGDGDPTTGSKNNLFFAAGPAEYSQGLFGKILPPKQ